jgi:hypothetical protein
MGAPLLVVGDVLVARQRATPEGVELVAQRSDAGFVQPVDTACSLGPAGDETGVLQHLEVLGHCGPAQWQRGGQFTDGLGSLGEAQDNGPARSVPERSKALVYFVSHHER